MDKNTQGQVFVSEPTDITTTEMNGYTTVEIKVGDTHTPWRELIGMELWWIVDEGEYDTPEDVPTLLTTITVVANARYHEEEDSMTLIVHYAGDYEFSEADGQQLAVGSYPQPNAEDAHITASLDDISGELHVQWHIPETRYDAAITGQVYEKRGALDSMTISDVEADEKYKDITYEEGEEPDDSVYYLTDQAVGMWPDMNFIGNTSVEKGDEEDDTLPDDTHRKVVVTPIEPLPDDYS